MLNAEHEMFVARQITKAKVDAQIKQEEYFKELSNNPLFDQHLHDLKSIERSLHHNTKQKEQIVNEMDTLLKDTLLKKKLNFGVQVNEDELHWTPEDYIG